MAAITSGYGTWINWCMPWYLFLFAMGVCAGHAYVRGIVTPKPWLGGLGGAFLLACLAHHLFPFESPVRPQYSLLTAKALIMATDCCIGAFAACALALIGSARAGLFLAARTWLSHPALVRLGVFAYSIYLMHIPIEWVLFFKVLPHLPALLSGNFSTAVLLGVPMVLGGAYLFFLVFERPFLNTRRNKSPQAVARDAALSPAP